jgi:predicted nucleic acid-binding protein
LNEAALDASVVLKWFHSAGESHVENALALRKRFEAGELRVLAPPLLWLEILNVAARRWRWTTARLEELAASLPELGFELIEPELVAVARWAATGLTAYDAAYVAVAEQAGVQLVTDDAEIVRTASEHAVALSAK